MEQQTTNTGFKFIAVHILDSCVSNIRKILSDEWYLFNAKYKRVGNTIELNNERNPFIDELYGQNISVLAIVGKNGCGKSSLMELIYRMINNLSYILTQGMKRPSADELYYIPGVHAELFFESSQRIGVLKCFSENGQEYIKFKWGNDEELFLDPQHGNQDFEKTPNDKNAIEYISKHFCYALVSNFAMMSLFSDDYKSDSLQSGGSWLDSLYNKNDGYQAAIGIEPYKGNGIINLRTQKILFKERITALIIYSHLYDQKFFDDYRYDRIDLRFNGNYLTEMFDKDLPNDKKGSCHPEKEIPSLINTRRREVKKGNKKDVSKTFAECIIENYGIDDLDLNNPVIALAVSYLVVKTLSIAEKYPQYNKKFGIVGNKWYYSKCIDSFNKNHKNGLDERGKHSKLNDYTDATDLLKDLCTEITNDPSHISKKIRQTINFLFAIKEITRQRPDLKHVEFHNYDDYITFLGKKDEIKKGLDFITNLYPPPFFSDTIYLRKGDKTSIPITSLSSGERQFLQTTVSIIYHLKNIISVQQKDGLAKYHSVALFLDEIEISFHPEYQKKFLSLFLDMIQSHGINKLCGINIILATHSPFILSDIPQENILYLKKGTVPDKAHFLVNPFCANVNDILFQSFFLSDGFMGDYAKKMVNDLREFLYEENYHYYTWDEENAKELIELIGEPILKDSMMKLYNSHFCKSDVDSLIKWHEQEIKRLNEKRQP